MQYGGVAGQLSSLQISRFSRSGNRLSVPVRPSQTVFAQYQHISGKPASQGQKPVPLSKIQLLNSLINNLQQMKTDINYSSSTLDSSSAQTDALIQKYAGVLHQAMKAIPESFGALGSSASSGMVFDYNV